MTLSEICIRRPVLATVLNLLIVVLGVVAWQSLPVREYPDVDVPVVSVSTVYFGASPQTVETSLTEPIEQVLNGIDGIRSVSSTSAYSVSQITVEFNSGTDLDVAANDVSNAVQQAVGELPIEAEKPVIRKADASSSPIIWLSLVGDRFSPVEKTDIADRLIKSQLQLLPGVAQVMIGGQREYAMRVWLDPERMAARGVEPSDVRRVIQQNNLQVPAGEVAGSARKFTLNVDAQIAEPRIFDRLVIRRDGDQVVRLEDVGWAEIGAANYSSLTRGNREPTVGIGVIRQSTANELEVSRAVRDALADIQAALPEGLELETSTDRTIFVEASLREAVRTLLIVFALVVVVNLVFLRSPTTTIITSVAIPISLIGTLAVMFVLGFSINVLTVLGLILAIGLLVDDSIVVLENIYRRQELGESPVRAAKNGAREVIFPVIATTAAVVAVLVPLATITGNTGRLFREFAWTMAAAVLLSSFVALTAVPMACALFLKLKRQHGWLYNTIESLLEGATAAYRTSLRWTLRHPAIVAVFLIVTVVGIGLLFRSLPSTLVPTEDRGEIMTIIRAPQGSTAAYTDRALRQAEEILWSQPEVVSTFAAVALGFGGPADTANGIVFSRLARWGERERKQQEVVAEIQGRYFGIPEALVFAVNPPSLGQNRRNADIRVILQSPDASLEEFNRLANQLVDEARQIEGLVNADHDVRLDNPQLDVIIDRERAADLGIPVSSVADALRLLVSEGPADDFVLRNRQYDVVMALAARHRSVPGQLEAIHLRGRSGEMVPLSAVASIVPGISVASLNHYDLQRSATVTANLAADSTLSQTLPQLLEAAERILPEGFSTALGGVSREFVESSGAIYLTFGLALLVIYLVLSAQFESFLHPITVMVSVPLACLGALGALVLMGQTLNIFSSIGIVLLVGLVTKNSILLVDFANQERARGTETREALRKAGRTRFRPILMTSVTSILGATPLAFAVGAGAESRQPIGVALVGGLLFSTVFTLVVIPAVHVGIIWIGEKLGLRTIPPEVVLHPEEPIDEAPARGGNGRLPEPA